MRALAILLLVLLPGCAGLQSLKSEVAERGAVAMDTARDDAEFMLCRGISIGAWVRRFGDSSELAHAWRTLCSQSIKQTPK